MARTIDRIQTRGAGQSPQAAPVASPKGTVLVRMGRESYVIFGRNIKKLVRIPMMLFFSLFQPMLWLLLFTQIFKRLGDFPQFQSQGYSSYLQFFAPSVLTMTVLTSAFQSGMGMVTDLEQGMLDKFLISPIHRSSVLIGKVFADATPNVLQGGLVILVATPKRANNKTGIH